MKDSRFSKLRGRLVEYGLSQADLSNLLGLCPMSISRRFTGKMQWRLGEIYMIMDLLDISINELELYFPRYNTPSSNDKKIY